MVHSCTHIQVYTRVCVWGHMSDVKWCVPRFLFICLFFLTRSLLFELGCLASKPHRLTCLFLFSAKIPVVHTVPSFPPKNTQCGGTKVSSSCLCTCTISTLQTEPALQHLFPFFLLKDTYPIILFEWFIHTYMDTQIYRQNWRHSRDKTLNVFQLCLPVHLQT